MAYSLKLVLNKGSRKNTSGIYSIYLRVIINSNVRFFNLGKKLPRAYWQDKEHNWVKPAFQFAQEYNAYLRRRFDDVRKHVYRLDAIGHAITFESIADFLERKQGSSNLFNDFAADYIERKLKGVAPNTVKKYNTFQRYLNQYGKLSFAQITEPTIIDFCLWLSRKGLAGPTILKYVDPFRAIARNAYKDGYFERDPFYGVTIPYKEKRVTDQVRLSLDEIKQIKAATIPDTMPGLAKTRDEFLFCFFAGFRYADLQKLSWADIKESTNGPYILSRRSKNDKPYVSPIYLFNHAVELLERQRGQHPEKVFPHVDALAVHNRKLKDLARHAGLNKLLTNSVARHSLIHFYASNGFPMQHIAKIAGHQYITTTMAYFELGEKEINTHAEKIEIDL